MSDKDSLFGSPPPSPSTRGRSPSLALPELPSRPDGPASSQNVGTLALPGSHSCSELPVFLDAALPSGKPPALSLPPPAKSAPPRSPPTRPRVAGSARRRKRSPTPNFSPVPHNPQTDRLLRDLVGLIHHFGPKAIPQSPPVTIPLSAPSGQNHCAEVHPLGTSQNPIIVDAITTTQSPAPMPVDSQGPADAVNNALVALASTVANALKLPTSATTTGPSLSTPTVTNVLHIIKHDPKLIPALHATYEYLGSIPKHPQQPPRPTSQVPSNSLNSAPKRRRSAVDKRSQVPAGAGHWNVPFPFAPGEEPEDYPSRWQLERGRRVLGDLLGLFERAFAQVRHNNPRSTATTQNKRPRKRQKTANHRPPLENARSDLESATTGASDQVHAASRLDRPSQLDHERMNEWLSSVPTSSVSSSIVESTMPSPCPSDGLSNVLAILGPDSEIFDAIPVDDKDDSFDLNTAFNDVVLDKDVQSLFSIGPLSQSINEITAYPMDFHGDLETQSSAAQSQTQALSPHLQSLDSAIDPVLMALSRQQAIAHGSSSLLGDAPSLPIPSMTPSFLQARSDSLPSSTAHAPQPLADLHSALGDTSVSNMRVLDTNGSLDVGSSLTVPASSASPSQVPSRCGSSVPPDIPASCVMPSASSKSSTAQRKATILAKARDHRARILKAIEEANTERWGTVIEGGVLRNLQKVDTP